MSLSLTDIILMVMSLYLLMLDARIWHEAGANKFGRSMWYVTIKFSRWCIKPSYDILKHANERFLGSLSIYDCSLLGFCNSPPFDEHERINIQGSYGLVP